MGRYLGLRLKMNKPGGIFHDQVESILGLFLSCFSCFVVIGKMVCFLPYYFDYLSHALLSPPINNDFSDKLIILISDSLKQRIKHCCRIAVRSDYLSLFIRR